MSKRYCVGKEGSGDEKKKMHGKSVKRSTLLLSPPQKKNVYKKFRRGYKR